MPKPQKHRLSPAKIPIDLNNEFEEAKSQTGDTHTQAVEQSIRLYVKAAKRKAKASS